tara:strand:+ start:150 stop:353 length:204 start_codon:yes stop_codon:yes gene_type:complete
MNEESVWTDKDGTHVKAKTMKNKYSGSCCICRETVEAETGTLRLIYGKWCAQHVVCPDDGYEYEEFT